MTKREYFNLLVERSAKGLFPSIDSEGRCKYRSPDGMVCPVGLIIPDDRYDVEMERRGVLSLVKDLFFTLSEVENWSGCTVEELAACQVIHDNYAGYCVHKVAKWNHEWFVMDIAAKLDIS